MLNPSESASGSCAVFSLRTPSIPRRTPGLSPPSGTPSSPSISLSRSETSARLIVSFSASRFRMAARTSVKKATSLRRSATSSAARCAVLAAARVERWLRDKLLDIRRRCAASACSGKKKSNKSTEIPLIALPISRTIDLTTVYPPALAAATCEAQQLAWSADSRLRTPLQGRFKAQPKQTTSDISRPTRPGQTAVSEGSVRNAT